MAKSSERVTFSPGEFAALFGKSQTWGYRQIYSGKVTAITEYGRILIPAKEVERILGTAGRYEGMRKPVARTKAEIEELKPELNGAWRDFLKRRREGQKAEPTDQVHRPKPSSRSGKAHGGVLERLADRRSVNR